MTNQESRSPMTEEIIREEKIRAALFLLSCSRCKTYTAIPAVDKSKPAVRVDWPGGFNVLHPLKDRTGEELCYYCQKRKDGYFEPSL